ncbi:hypothetical protein DFQ05_1002 [Winogradskyella wandonensis]|uniref:DoxX-like protein n=1 Tax=Winogradskyella wandonensis TaxID=1442586 RepID=A0A4R1KSH9_9FLAO|nr:hypothetical protein [Winogradskyella wandonensis]TCK67229.1 hypothetical protein DFQ05_1002 [Winogradskyella wandonensis]
MGNELKAKEKLSKSRHIILTIYLILLILTSLGTGIGSVLFYEETAELVPKFTKGLLYIQLFSTFVEIFSIYLIFKWQKFGFYGVILAYFLNLYISDKSGILNINTILGIGIRIGLLYGILQIKSKGVSGWKNLSE